MRNFSSLGQPAANKKDKISTSNFRPPVKKGQNFKGREGGLRLSWRSEIWLMTLGHTDHSSSLLLCFFIGI